MLDAIVDVGHQVKDRVLQHRQVLKELQDILDDTSVQKPHLVQEKLNAPHLHNRVVSKDLLDRARIKIDFLTRAMNEPIGGDGRQIGVDGEPFGNGDQIGTNGVLYSPRDNSRDQNGTNGVHPHGIDGVQGSDATMPLNSMTPHNYPSQNDSLGIQKAKESKDVLDQINVIFKGEDPMTYYDDLVELEAQFYEICDDLRPHKEEGQVCQDYLAQIGWPSDARTNLLHNKLQPLKRGVEDGDWGTEFGEDAELETCAEGPFAKVFPCCSYREKEVDSVDVPLHPSGGPMPSSFQSPGPVTGHPGVPPVNMNKVQQY